MPDDGPLEFDSLFRELYKSLCYFSSKYTPSQEPSEDLVQDAFLQLFNSREKFINKRAAKVFLYTCVRNAALNIARHRKVHLSYKKLTKNEIHFEDSILNEIIKSEVVGTVQTAIESLPGQCKKIFIKGYLEESHNYEIAEELGLSVNTVKTQKKKALKLLRTKLSELRFEFCILLFLITSLK